MIKIKLQVGSLYCKSILPLLPVLFYSLLSVLYAILSFQIKTLNTSLVLHHAGSLWKSCWCLAIYLQLFF